MKSGSNPRPADDEDFTSAAESLLGIDLSSSGLSGAPIDLDDADLFGEPDVVEPQPAEPPVAAVDETQEFQAVSAAAPLMDDDDFGDFGAGLVPDDVPPPRAEQRPAPRSQPKPAPRPPERSAPRAEERRPPRAEARPAPREEERPAPRAVERDVESDVPASAVPPAPRKDDSFWDALEGWDWSDEGTGASKSAAKEDAPPPRGRSGDRSRGRSRGDSPSRRSSERERAPERPAAPPPERPTAPPPERPRSRPVAKAFEDDFGGGLEDTPRSRGGERSADVSIFSLNPTESQSRYLDDRDDDAEPMPDVSTFGLNPSESQARYVDERDEAPRRPSSPPPPLPRAEFDAGDDFGAGIDEAPTSRREYEPEREGSRSGEESAEGEQRRGRRRRGRGRGQGQGQDRGRSEQSRPPVESRRDDAVSDEDLSFGGSFDEPPRRDESEDAEVQESRYTEIPTWAEAVALLVKARPRTSSGSGDRGRSESSSESQDRGDRGGNGGRGRGRGRRGGGRRSD